MLCLVYIPKFGNNYIIITCGTYYYEILDANYNNTVVEETDIVPIPLTPKILEKNGWDKGGKYTLQIVGFQELNFAQTKMKPNGLF